MLALVLAVAGCGDAPEPAGSGRTPSSVAPADAPVLVSGSAAGGRVSARAVPLAGPGLGRLTAGLGGGLAEDVERAAAGTASPAGSAAYGAVVAVGCDVPPGAVLTRRDGQVFLHPRKATGGPVRCLAPVTTVALAVVPGG